MSSGDRLGQLWTNGSQMFYGCCSNSIGGAGPQHNGDWLVQALPNLVYGGSKNGAIDPALLPDVFGEHYWSVLRATMRPDGLRQSASFCALCEVSWVALEVEVLDQTSSSTCAFFQNQNGLMCFFHINNLISNRVKRKPQKISIQNIQQKDASKEGRTSEISDSDSPRTASSASICSLIRHCHSDLSRSILWLCKGGRGEEGQLCPDNFWLYLFWATLALPSALLSNYEFGGWCD